jgi:hypothetical protein
VDLDKVFEGVTRDELVGDPFPYTTRYFRRAFEFQGVNASGLSDEEVEEFCMEYAFGERVGTRSSDWLAPDQHDHGPDVDELSSDLGRGDVWDGWQD